MEHPGHLEGMLDRDQRTAKLRFFNESDIESVPKTYSFQDKTMNGSTPTRRHCCCPTRTQRSNSSSTNSSHLACRNGYLLNTFQSVKNVLIVVCLTLATIPSASSAPTTTDMEQRMEERMKSPMKWINPCDAISEGASTENTKVSEFNSSELSDIINDATAALKQARDFSGNFAMQTFGKDETAVHEDFKNQKLPWLQLDWLKSKSLNEAIPDDLLKNLKIDDVLLNVYEILQRVAVGLEHITWDQSDNQTVFASHFREAEHRSKRVLCELHQVIEAHGLETRPDATRDIMSKSERIVDTTTRKGRDWMIFRDYMNTLQFLKQALEHLNKNLTISEN